MAAVGATSTLPAMEGYAKNASLSDALASYCLNIEMPIPLRWREFEKPGELRQFEKLTKFGTRGESEKLEKFRKFEKLPELD